MKVSEKLNYALQSVKSISTHDDAPALEVEAALNALKQAINSELKAMVVRKKLRIRDKLKRVFDSILAVFS